MQLFCNRYKTFWVRKFLYVCSITELHFRVLFENMKLAMVYCKASKHNLHLLSLFFFILLLKDRRTNSSTSFFFVAMYQRRTKTLTSRRIQYTYKFAIRPRSCQSMTLQLQAVLYNRKWLNHLVLLWQNHNHHSVLLKNSLIINWLVMCVWTSILTPKYYHVFIHSVWSVYN